MGKPQAVVLLPEPPYPAIGGGPLRSGSILSHLSERYEITAIHFRQVGDPDPAGEYPAGVLRRSLLVRLPFHSKGTVAKIRRNVWRAAMGVPPMVDRFRGHEREVAQFLAGEKFALAVVEHFPLAQYAPLLRPLAAQLVLDLHNVESEYFRALAAVSPSQHRFFLRRFANANEALERRWLERFDLVLTTSEPDRERVRALSGVSVAVLPNTIPWQPRPAVQRREEIVFTGNFEYQPNQMALAWFTTQCWPQLLQQRPNLRLRLVGKEIEFGRAYVHDSRNVDFVGPVEDAVAEIARAMVAVVPLRSGSGTRLKILEAWAAGTPVVSTPVGAEGLDGMPEEHIRIASNERIFTRAVLELLDNDKERSRLAENARELYEQRYTWRSASRILTGLGL